MKDLRGLALPVAFLLPVASHAGQGAPSIADLEFLIGSWEGEAALHNPREAGQEPRREDVRATCAYVLKDTYILCDTEWTRAGGKTRTFKLFFNYNSEDDDFQELFVYDNWPRHVSYLVRYDAAARTLAGSNDFENSSGESGTERVVWRFSEDGRELRGEEFNHLESEPEDYWPKTFDFVWRRLD